LEIIESKEFAAPPTRKATVGQGKEKLEIAASGRNRILILEKEHFLIME